MKWIVWGFRCGKKEEEEEEEERKEKNNDRDHEITMTNSISSWRIEDEVKKSNEMDGHMWQRVQDIAIYNSGQDEFVKENLVLF